MPTAALLAAYLLGSVPFAVWITRWLTGQDIRDHFSGNAGATNAGRVLKEFAGDDAGRARASKITKVIFLLDVAKGLGAVHLAASLHDDPRWPVLGGVCAILGHMFSPFLRFKGGKGVATSLGLLFGVVPKIAAISFALWLVVFLVTRWVSLGSVVAALSLPVLMWFLDRSRFSEEPVVTGILIALACFVTFKHRANLGRILAGTEPKAGSS